MFTAMGRLVMLTTEFQLRGRLVECIRIMQNIMLALVMLVLVMVTFFLCIVWFGVLKITCIA